jgi:hypothetical protein
MKLLTEEIKKRLPKLYATESIPLKDKVCVCKFFTPWTYWTWYVVEGSPREDGDWLLWGYVEGHENEWGYFLLSEMEEIRGPAGLKIERDLYHSGDGKKFREFHPDFKYEDDEPSQEIPKENPKPAVKEMALKIQQDIEDLIDQGDWK